MLKAKIPDTLIKILHILFVIGICTNLPDYETIPANIYFGRENYISNYRDICENNQCPDDTFYLTICHEGKNMVGSAIRICKGQNIWDPSRGQCVDDPTCE